jgi:hypothetical protein
MARTMILFELVAITQGLNGLYALNVFIHSKMFKDKKVAKKMLRVASVSKTAAQTGRSNTKEGNTDNGRINEFVKNLLEMLQVVSTELASSSSQLSE